MSTAPLIQNFNVTVHVLAPMELDAARALAYALGVELAVGLRSRLPRWRNEMHLEPDQPLIGDLNVELRLG